MTLYQLNKLCEKYDIADDVQLESDSGWECGPSDMDGVYYNEEKHLIVITQEISKRDCYHPESTANIKVHGYVPLEMEDEG